VLEYARKNNITKIIVGKPLKPRWREILTGSVVDQFVYASGDIDVYVISARLGLSKQNSLTDWQPHHPIRRYWFGIGLVILSTLLGLLVRGKLEPANLVMLYMASVVISAIFLGRGPSMLVAIAGVLAFDFFLIPPYLTLAVSDTQYIVTFAMLFIVSLVVSSLTAQVREQAEAATRREAQTSALYNLGRDLASATDLKNVAEIVVSHVDQAFGRASVIFLPENGHLHQFASSSQYQPDESKLAVAAWTFEHDQPAGRGTDTLPAVPLRCQPLKTANGLIGVLGIHPKETDSFFTPEQRQILNAFANQAALAIERASLAEQAQKNKLLQATEKLQTALFNSISHDLRTPLVSITGALSSLEEQDENQRSLVLTAREEADRLNRLVGNLLSMTRIESGAIKLHSEPGDIEDVIGTALDQLGRRIEEHEIQINVPEDFPLISMDFTLMVQVMVNLLENASKYSPQHSLIEVSAAVSNNVAQIQIADRGIGIPAEDLTRVFDKFYRVQRPENVSGTGLGLSICKGIVEAHHGNIHASIREGGGTIMTIKLPLDESKEVDNE
jgi:two-component system sensor histidine kinase KdpD